MINTRTCILRNDCSRLKVFIGKQAVAFAATRLDTVKYKHIHNITWVRYAILFEAQPGVVSKQYVITAQANNHGTNTPPTPKAVT